MPKKRVADIARERGLEPAEVARRLAEAGVKLSGDAVDEAAAARALGGSRPARSKIAVVAATAANSSAPLRPSPALTATWRDCGPIWFISIANAGTRGPDLLERDWCAASGLRVRDEVRGELGLGLQPVLHLVAGDRAALQARGAVLVQCYRHAAH